MSAIGRRLEQLSDDVAWFARARELRLHVIVVEDGARAPALRILFGGARFASRPVPYLLFLEPHEGEGGGWAERQKALDTAYAAVRDELQLRGGDVAEPAARPGTYAPHVAFSARLSRWLAATAEQTAGAVAILAPERVDAAERFLEELTAMVVSEKLAAARWVVVVPRAEDLAPLVRQLGALALTSDCVVPQDEAAADLDRMLANATAAPPGAHALAMAGMAWPAQAPPPRKHHGAVLPVPELEPRDAARLQLRTSLLQAALATRTGRGLDAVKSMRAAYDATVTGQLVDERVTTHLAMATTVAALGERRRAIAELELTRAEAMELGRPMGAAQAAQAKACLQATDQQLPEAIVSYGEAIAAAKEAGEIATPMLIDLLRVTGQLCLEAKLETKAVACWREAITLGEEQPPGEGIGAVEVARLLANLCRKRGLIDHAVSLEAQARRLAAPPIPDAEVG